MSSTFDILLYHGVHSDDIELAGRNSSGKHLPKAAFENQMRYLSENKNLVTMSEIASALNSNSKLPPDAVAVNFDDGFLNNYSVAWPVIEEYQIPTTIYLATGFIGTGKMVWGDRLEATILMTDCSELVICLAEEERCYPLRTTKERTQAYTEIKAHCKMLPNSFKDKLVSSIETQLGERDLSSDPLFAFMNWDQVRQMDASQLVDFGAHTVDHVSLARMPTDQMKAQISNSVETVSRELEHPCKYFSYPEGQSTDYNDEVIEYLKESGFDHSPSAINGSNKVEETSPFHIRRIMVGFDGCLFPFDPRLS
jgi:peptidoglycan/xylan/chitin deacetylase (PgdA/CDA1 family)